MTGYGILALAPIPGTIRLVKIAGSPTDYSFPNTTRQSLFLPTSGEAKDRAKTAIETLFYGSGDLLSEGLVVQGTKFALSPQRFSIINVAPVLVWLMLAVLIGRCDAALTGDGVKVAAVMALAKARDRRQERSTCSRSS